MGTAAGRPPAAWCAPRGAEGRGARARPRARLGACTRGHGHARGRLAPRTRVVRRQRTRPPCAACAPALPAWGGAAAAARGERPHPCCHDRARRPADRRPRRLQLVLCAQLRASRVLVGLQRLRGQSGGPGPASDDPCTLARRHAESDRARTECNLRSIGI
eukprot:scaffold28779_cov66-Phaeocystis_antarctica.AAC.5